MFEQHRSFEGTADTRIYRNVRMAAIVGVFALLVLGLILAQALRKSTPPGARDFGVALVVVLGLYALRAVRVQVRVSRDGVRVRNILTTRTIPWNEVAAVEAVPSRASSISPACNVAFRLVDGQVVRAQGLRREAADARAIADDLAGRFLPHR